MDAPTSTLHDLAKLLDELSNPINVLFLGLPGVGKSSTINLFHSLISDKDAIDALVLARMVDSRKVGSLTAHLHRVKRFGRPLIEEKHRVAVFDVKGLSDWEEERRTVKFLLDGRYKEGELVFQPWWFSTRSSDPQKKISVVFFVVSAKFGFPNNLAKVVQEECSARGIPVVCLITKEDQAGPARTDEMEKKLVELFSTDVLPVRINAKRADYAATRDEQASRIFHAVHTALSLGETVSRVGAKEDSGCILM